MSGTLYYSVRSTLGILNAFAIVVALPACLPSFCHENQPGACLLSLIISLELIIGKLSLQKKFIKPNNICVIAAMIVYFIKLITNDGLKGTVADLWPELN